ncbi:MAG: TetR/AcrR family transcriptional regulator [Coriobacteriales bacterium]|jgi:AcrR family transcriptional regulator|nr:TetR/AcrR family transcriptional regulator [Coriobacteriales bacterium]
MPRKTDRRVLYTKQTLKNALTELLRDKHISAITVTSICELADVNRSTFYLHYRDQFDLLQSMEREVFSTLEQELSELGYLDENELKTYEVIVRILEYVKANAEICTALLSENSDFSFRKEILEMARLFNFRMDPSYSEETREHLVLYSINGAVAMVERWIRDGAHEDPAAMASLTLQCIYYGMSSFAPK